MIKKAYWLLGLIWVSVNSLFAQESLTLTQLLDSAVQRNYLLQANEMQRKISLAEIDIIKTNYQPRIDASLSASYWKFLLPNKERLLGNTLTDVYTDIAVYQIIYDWGSNKVKREKVEKEAQITDELHRKIASTIIWDVSDTYFNTLKAQLEIEVHQNSLKQLYSHLQYTENLYNIGRVSGVDVLKIQVQISVEEKNLQIAHNSLQEQLIRLKRLCNLHENAQFQITDLSDSLYSARQTQVFNSGELFANAYHNHPALSTFDHYVSLENRQKEIYRLQNRPEIFSFGIATWEDGYIPFGNNFNYNFGLSLRYTLPLWGGSNFKVNMLKSDLRIGQITDEKKQAFLEIKKEIETALNEIDQKKSEISHNEKIIRLANETLNNAWVLYQSGQGSIIDVLDAQSILTDASISRGQSVMAYLQSLAKLNYITGNDNYPF